MKTLAGSTQFLIKFTPEQWSSATKLRHFTYAPLKDNKYYNRSIMTALDHFQKYKTLADLLNESLLKMDIDHQEVNETGHSPAIFSKRAAALIECCLNELYASLDGIRDFMYWVLKDRKIQGMQKKSTSKLFTKAKEGKYCSNFPKELTILLVDAHDEWFQQLNKYRTEFTHGSLGFCSKDQKTKKICYIHPGLGNPSRALVINDVIGYLNKTYQYCFNLQESVFSYFYQNLSLEPATVVCGFFQGLTYQRKIEPNKDLSFNSGECLSINYQTKCPLSDNCEAYLRAKK
ncbi:hypothetical protein [Kangiella sp. M94]